MPINLRVADRLCLVVGGGRVALRKCISLQAAGAQVRLVSPSACPGVRQMAATHQIEYIERPFERHDINHVFLVFACTHDHRLNRCVLTECRKAGILCSCVDGNWPQSDFTSPAVTRREGLTLTVSTGGQSCRRARLVKDSLARHMESIETADLVVAGTDQRFLRLEEREPFHLAGPRLERIGSMLMQLLGVHEFMLLNTCNRIELLAVASHATTSSGMLCHALGFDRLPSDRYYQAEGAAAWEHSALVCAGMLSQTPGESHIAGQMKNALSAARKRGWAAGMMQEWMASALHMSKHIKNEVVPDIPVWEIEDLALDSLDRHGVSASGHTILIIGSGAIGQALVARTVETVDHIIWCYHRQQPEIPKTWANRVSVHPLHALGSCLNDADAVVSAVEAPHYVLGREHASLFKRGKAVLLIDLGVPRNIDPALADEAGTRKRLDLETLKQENNSRQREMNPYILRCRDIIHAHREQYEKLMQHFQGSNAH